MKFFDGDDPLAQLLCVSAVTFEYGVPGEKAVVFELCPQQEQLTEDTVTDGCTIHWYNTDAQLIQAFFRCVFTYFFWFSFP